MVGLPSIDAALLIGSCSTPTPSATPRLVVGQLTSSGSLRGPVAPVAAAWRSGCSRGASNERSEVGHGCRERLDSISKCRDRIRVLRLEINHHNARLKLRISRYRLYATPEFDPALTSFIDGDAADAENILTWVGHRIILD